MDLPLLPNPLRVLELASTTLASSQLYKKGEKVS